MGLAFLSPTGLWQTKNQLSRHASTQLWLASRAQCRGNTQTCSSPNLSHKRVWLHIYNGYLRVEVLVLVQLITPLTIGAPKSGRHCPQFLLLFSLQQLNQFASTSLKELVHISSALTFMAATWVSGFQIT